MKHSPAAPCATFLAILLSSVSAENGAFSGGVSELGGALEAIRAVDREGAGNTAAARAFREISKAGGAVLPVLLEAMDGANPLAANWLHSAVDVIVDRELAAGNRLPLGDIGEFLLDTRHDARARQLAFDLIARVDPATGEALVPGMLHDPSSDLRRDAVQGLIDDGVALAEAESESRGEAAAVIFRQALGAARDVDQIEDITRRLRDLGREVDLPHHFGFLMHWNVIGPFDNTERSGFDRVFPPEEEIDLAAAYPGKEIEGKSEVKWRDFVSTDEYGMVDINKPYGMLKEVTAYAFTEFNSATSRPAELRLGCKNAWKIWLNGELVFGRDEYHRGMRIDQYRLPVQLDQGKNTILVKLCQDHQTQDWTVEWQFQLRVCDAAGTAIMAVDRPPTPVAEEKPQRRRPRN